MTTLDKLGWCAIVATWVVFVVIPMVRAVRRGGLPPPEDRHPGDW